MKVLNTSFDTLPVKELMEKHSIPGCTLAVIRAGEVAFSNAYGVRNEQGTPMTEGVLF